MWASRAMRHALGGVRDDRALWLQVVRGTSYAAVGLLHCSVLQLQYAPVALRRSSDFMKEAAEVSLEGALCSGLAEAQRCLCAVAF